MKTNQNIITVAIWGAQRPKMAFNSKRLFKLPRSRDCHRFEGERFPQVLISKPNKDLSPRCQKLNQRERTCFVPVYCQNSWSKSQSFKQGLMLLLRLTLCYWHNYHSNGTISQWKWKFCRIFATTWEPNFHLTNTAKNIQHSAQIFFQASSCDWRFTW